MPQQEEQQRGTIYIAHLPFGFFEDQIWAFFSQFGSVTKVRVVRNPKTGKSRHYGFVEFELEQVAKIAAESMDKYLMFGKCLVAKVVPAEKLGSVTWGKDTMTCAPPNLYTSKTGAVKLMPRHRSRVGAMRLSKARLLEKSKRAFDLIKQRSSLKKRHDRMMSRLSAQGVQYSLE
jgi:nucleolar protein 15